MTDPTTAAVEGATAEDARRARWLVPMTQAELDDLEGVYFYDDGYAAADDVQRLLATLDAARAHTGSEREAGLDDEDREFVEFVARQPVGFGDWACVECKPGSDMLVEGFRCLVHRAQHRLRSAAPTGASRPDPDDDPLIPDPRKWLRTNWTAPLDGEHFIQMVEANSLTRRVVRRIVHESPTGASRDGPLRDEGTSLADIDARLASGYAEFKQPLMVAVADVSALRAATAASSPPTGASRDGPLREAAEQAFHWFAMSAGEYHAHYGHNDEPIGVLRAALATVSSQPDRELDGEMGT